MGNILVSHKNLKLSVCVYSFRRVTSYNFTEVSEVPVPSIIRAMTKSCTRLKYWETSARLLFTIIQKANINVAASVNTSNITKLFISARSQEREMKIPIILSGFESAEMVSVARTEIKI
jgi:hypothetical protein